MLATSGNRLAQLASNSTLKPTAVRSVLNVAVQVLSRSALENSQLPSMPLADSPSAAGVCATAGPADARARAKAAMRTRFIYCLPAPGLS